MQIFSADFSVHLVILKFTKLLFARPNGLKLYIRESRFKGIIQIIAMKVLQKCLHKVNKN